MSDIDLDLHIDSATKALLACQHADGHFLFELEADATVPAEYVLLRHYLGEPVDAALEAGIAAFVRRIQEVHGGGAPVGAGRTYAPRPRGGAAARRRRAQQCVHALPARALRHRALARGAGDAGRDHAVAEMVSLSPRQNFVLEPHGDRAASGADGEEAPRAQSEGDQC